MAFLRFRARLRNMLRLEDSPRKIAMSFAVGVFIGFSPFLGVHTVLGLLTAYFFRLNRLATVTGVFVTNPISIVPIYTFCIWLGTALMGMDITDLIIEEIAWENLTMTTMYMELQTLLIPFLLGTVVAGFVGALISYYSVRAYVQRDRWDRDKWPYDDDKNGSYPPSSEEKS